MYFTNETRYEQGKSHINKRESSNILKKMSWSNRPFSGMQRWFNIWKYIKESTVKNGELNTNIYLWSLKKPTEMPLKEKKIHKPICEQLMREKTRPDDRY